MQTNTNQFSAHSIQFTQPASILEQAARQLESGCVRPALDRLFDDLEARREQDGLDWPAFRATCLSHPLRQLLHTDPFTWRAFSKPRGYAGDAVMMDYIYGMGQAAPAAHAATPLGREIFRYMDTRPSARAVRFRRGLIGRMLDNAADRPDSRVLAVAAGHLREVELSTAARERRFAEFVAFDQDQASLALVARDYARFGVKAQPGSVRHILAGKAGLGHYDFVYAAGLYDYLNAPVAAALTRRLFEMTRPGGTLLIPNFVTGMRDIGYMETFMDWSLIYRDHSDMYQLAMALPMDQISAIELFNDPDDTIAFLTVTKSSRL
jgi:hypothetical protein